MEKPLAYFGTVFSTITFEMFRIELLFFSDCDVSQAVVTKKKTIIIN